MTGTHSVSVDSLFNNHFSPKNSRWLAENLQDVHHTFEQLTKLMEADENTPENVGDESELKRPQLTALVQKFYKKYHSLAERYDHMTGKLQQAMPENALQIESKEPLELGLEQGSPNVTPQQKLHPPSSGRHHASYSSGDGSVDISLKEGSESSLSSDSESESNSSVNSYLGSVVPINDFPKHKKKSKLTVQPLYVKENILSSDEMDADKIEKSVYGRYEELIGKVMHSEEQLMVLNLKLQQSEENVKMLRTALDQSESVARDLQAQLEAAHVNIRMKDIDLEVAKAKAVQLEEQIVTLGVHISDSDRKAEMLITELKTAEEKLDRANEEAALLLTKLDSERNLVVELQERSLGYANDVRDRECQIMDLHYALTEAQEKFVIEKEQLLSLNSSQMEQQKQAEASLREWEFRCKQLEENLRQCEEEELATKELHDGMVSSMQGSIDQLKAALDERHCQVENLNKDFDELKLNRDMVVTERDGLTARIQTLLGELRCKDIQIQELTIGAVEGQKLASELRSRVAELEKEVDMQKVLISDGAEKKREAIRQLCFSLEHYRSGYQELREAFLVHKRHTVLAS